jgi:hypothetical protein
MKKTIHLALKVFGACLLGVVVTAWVMQQNPHTLAKIEQALHTGFGQAFDCISSGKVTSINLLWPTIEMESVVVKPRDGSLDWHWSCRKAVIKFSWFSTLLHRAAPLHITLYDVRAHSVADDAGRPAIGAHIKKLGAPVVDGLPVFAKELVLKNVVSTINNPHFDTAVLLHGHATMRKSNNAPHWSIYPLDGSLTVRGKTYLDRLSGSLHIKGSSENLFVDSSLQCSLTFLDEIEEAKKLCFLRATWDRGSGKCELHTADRSLMVGPVTGSQYQFAGQITTPLSYLQKVIPGLQATSLINGTCTIRASGDVRNIAGSLRGDITMRDVVWSGITLPAMQFTLSSDQGIALGQFISAASKPISKAQMTGILDLQTETGFVMTGSWSWHPRKGMSCAVRNVSAIQLPLEYWHMRPEDLQIDAQLDRAHNVQAIYSCILTHEKLGTQHTSSGTISHTKAGLAIKGLLDKNTIQATADAGLNLQKATVHDAAGATMVLLNAAQDRLWTASIDYNCIRSLLPSMLQQDCTGQGNIFLQAQWQDNNVLDGSFVLQNGTVRIPYIHNFLDQLSGSFKWSGAQRSITMRDMKVGFHRGSLEVPQASLYLDEHYRIQTVHAPLIVENMFARWQKDVCGALSGGLLLQKKPDSPLKLQGNLFADKSYVRSLDALQPKSATIAQPRAPELDLDLRLMSRGPVEITTDSLDAKVSLDMSVRRNLANPQIAGEVKFLSGLLKFPYKPMHIMSGMITFAPGQEDPTIELVAKNKIRKYNIGLQVSGTVADPHITVDASPPLTQEQIIALLLTGAEEGSLNILMPTFVVQNLQQSLLNSHKPKAALYSYFKTLLKPLSRVRLVPRFTEESGRGGLRGAIEIEVSEDLNATIEKNFSLTEDIKFKIDYSLSDDVSLRGIQDERGDLGSEMEMRWRF